MAAEADTLFRYVDSVDSGDEEMGTIAYAQDTFETLEQLCFHDPRWTAASHFRTALEEILRGGLIELEGPRQPSGDARGAVYNH